MACRWSSFMLLSGGLEGGLEILGVRVVEAESLGVGDHVGEGELGGATLAPAVFEHVIAAVVLRCVEEVNNRGSVLIWQVGLVLQRLVGYCRCHSRSFLIDTITVIVLTDYAIRDGRHLVGIPVSDDEDIDLGEILYKFWYTIRMAGSAVIQVHPLSEVRARLSGILARFRHEGSAAEPVAFGTHRKPEAVLLPYETYERYEAMARQRERLDWALSAAGSVRAELPGPFTPEHDREVAAYVDGQIDAAELYRRTVARYKGA